MTNRRSWAYNLGVLGVGLALLGYVVARLVADHAWSRELLLTALVAVPLILVVARFPIVLDRGTGGIEIGFDSTVLMYLLCALDADSTLAVWSAGVVLTQLLTRKRTSVKAFNIGVGIAAGALATGVYHLVATPEVATPRALLAVTLAAAAYFLADYVLSALGVALDSRTSLRSHLLQRESLLAIACFVPFDLLGYLAAIVKVGTPWWTLSLLGVPLATLLVATRALTRGRENARRLSVLFDASVRAQTLTDEHAVIESLLADARELLRIADVRLSSRAPEPGEIGAEVQMGDGSRWLVARATNRARSTVTADEQALRALAAVASDAVARLDLTAEMVHVARHDPLTDLPNRGILLDRMTGCLDHMRRHGGRAALLFIDLDGFKPVNDRFGHAAGDAVLLELAERLRGCVRRSDTVARLGGDEFAILLDDVERVDLRQVCERVVAAVGAGVQVRGQRVRLGASVGLAYGSGGDTAAEMLRNADLAMYEAKARGKGRYVEYEPTMGQARVARLELVDDLRRAVERGQIDVAYQPLVAVRTGRIVAVEALARWTRAGTPVPPDVFISAAEETGLIVALGDAVLSRVASDTPAIVHAAGGTLTVSVNISAVQLHEQSFPDRVANAARRMRGAKLVLEITERQGVDLTGTLMPVMCGITELGVDFSIDDFGVGFSSISYLHDLPAQSIKVDAALSGTIDSDERARALLNSAVLMGQALGFRVVVEGIERRSQLDVLRTDTPEVVAQGYYFHRPMPLAEVLAVIAADRSGARPDRDEAVG